MNITQFYPVILSDQVAETVDFYRRHFAFATTFESNWYVHLQSTVDVRVNLAVLEAQHETIPESGRGKVTGLIINFEVKNVDEIYEQMCANDLEIVQPLRDEPFGQRHFIARDPNGVLVDVITPIPPDERFLRQYVEAS